MWIYHELNSMTCICCIWKKKHCYSKNNHSYNSKYIYTLNNSKRLINRKKTNQSTKYVYVFHCGSEKHMRFKTWDKMRRKDKYSKGSWNAETFLPHVYLRFCNYKSERRDVWSNKKAIHGILFGKLSIDQWLNHMC